MEMNDKIFQRLTSYIYDEMGIKMGENKRVMLQARLAKRIRIVQLDSFESYCTYLFSNEGQREELASFIHEVTTNKTDFYREPNHFSYLTEQALPTLSQEGRRCQRRPLRCWSSACSTGEEPYTLAIFLHEYEARNPGFSYTVLATDISTTVLREAKDAIYDLRRIDPIPPPIRKKYILRSKNKESQVVRIAPELRARVEFRWTNLKEPKLTVREMMDVIFCRNVIIYFDQPTQELVLNNLCRQLVPGGFIFMGHSENLNGLNVPLVQIAPTIYRKINAS